MDIQKIVVGGKKNGLIYGLCSQGVAYKPSQSSSNKKGETITKIVQRTITTIKIEMEEQRVRERVDLVAQMAMMEVRVCKMFHNKEEPIDVDEEEDDI